MTDPGLTTSTARTFRWERERRHTELVIVPRDEWGGPPLLECEYFEKPFLSNPVPHIILSYTETDVLFSPEECKEKLYQMHLDAVERGLWTVPFNFVVGGDGTVYECRGWKRKPERSRVFPALWGESMEIAHFGRKGKPPSINQINGSWLLTLFGMSKKYITHKSMPDRHPLFV
ncbi:peptidoglycan-recognition protein SB2-like [Macrosteles quadrilineatus]|uniref:peptidoglycan-recognition protein SB2-like n=1 Tax=Macrosteles quadrilineatus TaxID=74068 RepID=UPI0023E246BC|nr:peptidoglycan-recognition protein SB2-like [Macrosteles quadrilineatus]